MDEVIQTLERLAADPSGDMDTAAAEVRRAAGDDRTVLESVRREFQRRIRRRSDDFTAQRALRTISAALAPMEREAEFTYFNQTAYR